MGALGDDLIRRQDAVNACIDAEFREEAMGRIRNLPSAEPQIIRCKDCKYYEHYVDNDEYGVCCNPQWVVGNVGCGVSAIDYCSYAERMEVKHEAQDT